VHCVQVGGGRLHPINEKGNGPGMRGEKRIHPSPRFRISEAGTYFKGGPGLGKKLGSGVGQKR